MLSAACIDLAALFVHLVAANVFGAHATCNRLATVASSRGPFHAQLVPIERERDCPKICRSPLPASAQAEMRGPQPTQPTVPPTGAGHNTQTHTDLGRWQLTIAIVEQSAILTERRSALHRFITLSLRISHAEGGWVREEVVGGRTAGGGGAEAAKAADHGRAGALESEHGSSNLCCICCRGRRSRDNRISACPPVSGPPTARHA